MSKTMRFATFAEWYDEPNGAAKIAEQIRERLNCTQAAALQIVLLMDLDGMFPGDRCQTCGHTLDDDPDHESDDSPLF